MDVVLTGCRMLLTTGLEHSDAPATRRHREAAASAYKTNVIGSPAAVPFAAGLPAPYAAKPTLGFSTPNSLCRTLRRAPAAHT